MLELNSHLWTRSNAFTPSGEFPVIYNNYATLNAAADICRIKCLHLLIGLCKKLRRSALIAIFFEFYMKQYYWISITESEWMNNVIRKILLVHFKTMLEIKPEKQKYPAKQNTYVTIFNLIIWTQVRKWLILKII